MALLTFTSDFGHRDHYVAAVKGAILSQLSDVTIVDISHEVNAEPCQHRTVNRKCQHNNDLHQKQSEKVKA